RREGRDGGDEGGGDAGGEREELQLIYEAKGLNPAEAEQLSRELLARPRAALEVLTREELGIDPGDLGGSPWRAAGTSFVLFAVGAVVPVLPLLFVSGWTAVGVSGSVSAPGLFGIRAAITVLSGRSVWRTGLRQMVLGLAAAGSTFVIGRLVGVAIG